MRWQVALTVVALACASCGDAVPDLDSSPDGGSGESAIEITDAEPSPPGQAEAVTSTAAPITTIAEPVVDVSTTTTPTSPTTTTAPATTTTTTAAPTSTVLVADTPNCVRDDIDFAAVRAAATTGAEKIAELAAGSCSVVFTGDVEVVDAAGEMWLAVDLGGVVGWSAARLFDIATLNRDTGLVVAFSQVSNRITGGVGGPVVTDQVRSSAEQVGAIFPWNGNIESCGTGDSVVCTWFSSDDSTEVFIDVRFVFGNRGWSVDAVASGSCGGEGCGGLR